MVSPTASSYLDSHNLLAAPLPPHTKHPDTSRIQIACSKTFFPKTWFSKPKLLNLTSAFETFTSKTPQTVHIPPENSPWRVENIRNLPLSDGNLRNPMCERRPHGQPGNQEVRRVEFTKAYRLGKKKHFPPKTNALTSLTLGITPQKNHAKALLQPKDKTSPNHPDFV